MSDRFSSLPDDDKFASLPDDNEIEPSGNVLQRAVKGFTEIDPRQVGYSVASGNAPSDIGGFLASKFMGRPSGIGNMSTQAEGAREDVVNKIDNPLLRIGTDIVTDPMTYVGTGGTGSKIIPKIGDTARKSFGWFAEPWQNVSKINKFKSQGMLDISQEALQKESQAIRTGSLRKQVVQKLYGDEPMSNVLAEKSFLEKAIPKSTHKEALNLQKELPALYRKQSTKFGDDLRTLIGDKPVSVPAKELQPALEQSLLEHGILKYDESGNLIASRAPISAKESKIFNMYRNNKSGLLENPEISIDASDLIKSQDAMKTNFGKTMQPDDMLMSTVKKNVSKVLEPYIPGLKELRSSHAPFLKGKYQSIKELNPFSTQYETGKASGFLQKYAKGTLAPDEKNLVGFLEKELGRDIAPKAKTFGNRLAQNPIKEASVRSKLKETLSGIDKAVEDSITAIKSNRITSEKQIQDIVDESIRRNNIEKWKKAGAGGAVLEILRRTIFGKVLNWYSKKPQE